VNITSPADGAATNGTLYDPVMNTAQNNPTTTNASGSVIMRLR